MQPHRRQPIRLPHPWDSPGKNTGVGCHFLLQCMKVKSESEVVQSSDSLRPHGLQPTRLLRPWDIPGKSTGVGCHCLLLTGYTPMQNKVFIITRISTAGVFFPPKVLTTSGGVSPSMNPQRLLLPYSLLSPGHHVSCHKHADWRRGPHTSGN